MKRFGMMVTLGVLVQLAVAGIAVAEDQELSISGFVDTHWGKVVKGLEDVPSNNSGSFFLDAVVVYLEKPIGSKYRVFADVGFYNDGGASVDQAFVEGAYLDGALTLTFGKFDAPIGFELVDAPDLYQFSHSIVFVNLIPGFHTGVWANYAFTDMVDLSVYLTNGIDLDADDNKEKGFGARLGVSTDTVAGGVSLVHNNPTSDVYDDEGTMIGGYNEDATLDIIDIDLSITPSDSLVIGGEFNMNMVDDGEDGDDPQPMGILAMGHLDFMSTDSYTLGATLRLGYIDWDTEDSMTQTEITAALTGVLDPAGATFVVEYRIDDWDSDNAPDETDVHTLAMEFVFLF